MGTYKLKINTVTGLLIFAMNAVYGETLTCNKLSTILINLPPLNTRPYCNTAEMRCRALTLLHKRSEDDTLRIQLEPKLTAQVEYELELCEMAVREVDHSYLEPRCAE